MPDLMDSISVDNDLIPFHQNCDIQSEKNLTSTPWLTPNDAARYLRISVSKIYKLIAYQQIPFHKPPHTRITRFHRDELDQWMRTKIPDPVEFDLERILRSIK